MIDYIKAEAERLSERIDRLTLRERALVFVTLLVVLYFLVVGVLWGPLNKKDKQLQSALQVKQQQVQLLQSQARALGVVTKVDNRKRLAELAEQIRNIDSALAGTTSGLVSPREMAKLVEQLLRKNRRLQLVKVESLTAEPLLADKAGRKQGAPAMQKPESLIYKHGLRVQLKGRYVDIVSYLKALEALPWKVFWGEVTLETEKYPISQLTLVLHTLSFDEGWIGT